MTNKKIPCEMIQDILPLYVDKLTSEVTNREIEEHLADCETCRESKKRLGTALAGESKRRQQEEKQEIDYLKKVRRSGSKRVIISVFAVATVFLLVCVLNMFLIGAPQNDYAVLYTNVYEDRVEIAGMCFGSAQAYRGYKLKELEDGTTELIIYTALPSVFSRSGNFKVVLNLDEIGSGVKASSVTIKVDGTVIGSMANAVYEAKNPYVGDMPANGRLVQALGLTSALGGATTELQTTEEPYGWTFHFLESPRNSVTFDERMKAYACVLIAMTGNLSEVRWTYTVELAEEGVMRESSITAQECSEMVGADIKSFSESPEKVQELLAILELK